MFTSFSTALSALSATAEAIDAVGNDLANMNTVGYKATDISFSDLVAQSMALSQSADSGLGVSAPTLTRQFSQGAITSSSGSLDAAISGRGFFVVHDPKGNMLLTRAGNFQLDKNGNLVSAGGDQVQGWTAVNGQINTSGAPSSINIPVTGLSAPVPTTQMSLNMNLDAGATAATSFSTPVQVVDSLGTQHVVTLTFTKASATSWSVAASCPDGTASLTGLTSLTFDNTGHLTQPAASTAVTVAVKSLNDGAADLSIGWSLYDSNGIPTITQFGQSSAVSGVSQNGFTPSQITGVKMSDGGQIVANYSNGQQVTIAQLAMASVQNPESLVAVGDNNFQTTAASDTPAIGMPETGARGKIVGGALESSTVDMAQEFTQLIQFQRSYEASAKVITASDELVQQTVNVIH